jgi:lysophospholipase L1-like esterase
MKISKILISSILINILVLVLGAMYVFKRMLQHAQGKSQTLYDSCQERQDIFFQGNEATHKQPEPHKIIFLGDSLTAFGNWSEGLHHDHIINRGIAGDTTCGVQTRLEPILKSHPQQVFLMIGINDLIRGTEQEYIKNTYQEILNSFKEKSPQTQVFVESLLPVKENNSYSAEISNQQIQEINRYLVKISQDFDYEYINLFPLFIKNDELNPALHIDGLHLNHAGYAIWKKEIAKYIKTPKHQQ